MAKKKTKPKKKPKKRSKKRVTVAEVDERLRAAEATLRVASGRAERASAAIFKHVDAHAAVGWPVSLGFPRYSQSGLATSGGLEYRKVISRKERKGKCDSLSGPVCDVIIVFDPADGAVARIDRKLLVPSHADAEVPCTAEAFEAALVRALEVLV